MDKVGHRADPVGGRQLLVAALLDVAPLLRHGVLIDDKLDSAVTLDDADDDLGDRDRIRNDDQGEARVGRRLGGLGKGKGGQLGVERGVWVASEDVA